MRNFLSATSLLVGTIIGAGVFALPSAAARSGLPVALGWLVFLAFAVTLIHVMYGDVVLKTPERHRLPGYARLYLGIWGWRLAKGGVFLGTLGSLAIYVMLLGMFSRRLFPWDIPEAAWAFVGWLVLTAVIVLGLKTVARVEFVLSFALIGFLALISAKTLPGSSFPFVTSIGSLEEFFLPYGAFFFALSGLVAVPEARDVFTGAAPRFRRAIVAGTLIPAVLYGVLVVAFVGAFGPQARGDLIDLVFRFGALWGNAMVGFGILAVATSYLTVGAYLIDALRYDFRVGKRVGSLLLLIPLAPAVLGAVDFIELVAVVGAVMGLADGALVMLVWLRMCAQGDRDSAWTRRIAPKLAYAMIGVFILGALFETASILSR